MLRTILIAALALAPLAAASAQDKAPADPQQVASTNPPQRVRSVLLYGDQPCPKADPGEVVVCSREDANEQYRIPKAFRDAPKKTPPNNSWVNKAAIIDETSRVAGGLSSLTCLDALRIPALRSFLAT